MGYVTHEFYTDVFHGATIEQARFDRLVEDAGDLIDNLVMKPVTETDQATAKFKRAVCYQVELLFIAGGMEGINDVAVNGNLASETLDDYSVSRSKVDGASSLTTQNQSTCGGIPISTMTIAALRQMGYLNRWVYAGEG